MDQLALAVGVFSEDIMTLYQNPGPMVLIAWRTCV